MCWLVEGQAVLWLCYPNYLSYLTVIPATEPNSREEILCKQCNMSSIEIYLISCPKTNSIRESFYDNVTTIIKCKFKCHK